MIHRRCGQPQMHPHTRESLELEGMHDSPVHGRDTLGEGTHLQLSAFLCGSC